MSLYGFGSLFGASVLLGVGLLDCFWLELLVYILFGLGLTVYLLGLIFDVCSMIDLLAIFDLICFACGGCL